MGNPSVVKMARDVDDAEYEQHLKNLDVYGYTVVPAFLRQDVAREFKDLVELLWGRIETERYQGRPNRDVRDKLVYNLQNKDKRFIDLLGHAFVRRICVAKLNDRYYRMLPADRPNYILNYYNARMSGDKLDLHIDSYVPNRDWCTAMQTTFLLDDMDESNGCTVVVPGSHRSGEYSDRGLQKDVPVLAKGSDLVIWDSRTWHGTRENTRTASRWALVATFTAWWMKQCMDITRSLPEEIYVTLSDEQKAMLGFCSIPPRDERERINTKCGYESLKKTVAEYHY